jgi:dihydroorotase
LPVTGEAAPHHFSLTDADVGDYDTNAKMNPPLRSDLDRDAVRIALADGTLDAIATDHAPHGPGEKQTVFDQAANGIVGLETAISLGLALVREGRLSRRRLVELFTLGPSRVIPAFQALGSLRVGSAADVTLVDPEQRWLVEAAALRSKSKNSPWLGKQLQGRVVCTLVRGKIVHRL